MIGLDESYLLLIAVIGLIYLYDCVLLLYVDEAVIEQQGGRWRVAFGSEQTWVRGRRIHLLHPLRPLARCHRVGWRVEEALPAAEPLGSDGPPLTADIRSVDKLRRQVQVTAIVVLIVLPLAILFLGALGVLFGFALAWMSALALVIRCGMLRKELCLGRGEFAVMAFECVACPPCAINLLRKLCLRAGVDGDLVGVARGMDDRSEAVRVLGHIRQDVDARLAFLEDEDPRRAPTLSYRQQLADECERIGHTPEAKA